MHGTSAGAPVSPSGFGGLVTLAKPETVPEGASPRTYDTDYDVGSVRSRAGLTSVYRQADAQVGPNAPTEAISSTWSNPNNILIDDGSFATYTPGGTLTQSSTASVGTSLGSGAPWASPSSVNSSSVYTSVALGAAAGVSISYVVSVDLTGLVYRHLNVVTATTNSFVAGQFVTFTGTGTLLDGQSYYILTVFSGTSFQCLYVDVYVESHTGSVGSGGIANSSQQLQAMLTGISIPSAAAVVGIQVSFSAYYSGVAPTTTFSVGTDTITFTATTTAATYTFGGAAALFGQSWTPASVASLVGIIQAASTGITSVFVNNYAVTIYYQFSGTENSLDVDMFSFSIPSSNSISGIQLAVTGYSNSPCNLIVQLLFGGVPVGVAKVVALPQSNQTFTLGSLSDLWGTVPTADTINSAEFGVRFIADNTDFPLASVFLDFATIVIGVQTGEANFDYIGTFTQQNGNVNNIALDADGNLYLEDVTNNPGVLNLIREGITPNSYAIGVNGPDVEYLAISNGLTGSDMPLQYTPGWIDRITQVGPGASPTFSATQATMNTYNISTITQPAQKTGTAGTYYLQSSGPGSTSPGNVVTVYYSDSTNTSPPQDTDLVNAFNSGNAVYLYLQFSGYPTTIGPYTQLITSVGEAQPPGQPRNFYYFTYNVPSVAFTYYAGSGHTGYQVTYQRSLATMTMAQAVPGLEVGNKVTISGSSVSSYNSQWTISQTPNSGQYVITETQISSGVATFSYAYSGGTTTPPAAGQLVTITNTTGANGQLNLTNATIVTGGAGATGTFTVNVSLPDESATSEDGLATTAGTVFDFDPGANVVGTSGDPIFGNATGGSFTFAANAQFISNGTRQGTVFFITRNGYYTAPAPPVTFTTPENTTAINVSNIPIGPPNVIARAIAITEAGQDGVPGANFFTLPTQVQVIVNNLVQTSTSLFVNDNISTSTTVAFSDSVLLNGLAIGEYGYNLFNQIEIGDPAWVVSYASRNFYGLCWNKIQNFTNLSFDGGYLPNARLTPLGWTINDAYGVLVPSPKFGNSWYIQNTTNGVLSSAGSISQGAYESQDTNPPGTSNGTPILNANTTYSVRITARIPSGLTTGNLVVSLSNLTNTLGTFTLPFSSMQTSFQIFTGTLLTSALTTVPSGLLLNVLATNLGVGADVEIDRLDIYPTEIPILTTTVYGSYAGLPEQVDAVTGQVVFASENQQPVNGAVVMYDTLYGLKGWAGTAPGASLYSLQSSANLEPAQWQEPEVAQKSGAIGILAYDFGEQWIVMANRNGLYLFEGGQPGKITQEIYQVWDSINWAAASTIWVRNIVSKRKMLIGVPMATPNFWLPNAPVNANPTTPNVMLMLNYQGLDSGQELKSEPQMHTTMFGTLNAIDMRRKWSLWQIPSPYAAVCQGATDQQFYICNGRGNSKIYELDETAETDDGIIIDSLYTTAGLVPLPKRQETPGAGNFRLRWGYQVAALESAGTVTETLYPNRLIFPLTQTLPGPTPGSSIELPISGYNTWTVPGGLTPGKPALNDAECSLNFAATRTFFEFRENDGHGWSLSNLMLHVKKDVWNALRGRTGV